ncbi:MAG: signal peptide peptidase SppA [Eubacteriales bacterium]
MNEEQRNVYKYKEQPVVYDIGIAKSIKKKRNLNGILIFAAVVAFVVIIAVLLSMTDAGGTGNSYPSDDFIARVDVKGTIAANSNSSGIFASTPQYDHNWTVSTIDELIDKDSNKGLLIYVNTPGGSVYETDELYLKIKEYQQKTKRPVYAVMGNIAASGGYYISAPCDKILANRNTWTGSIGVTLGNIMDFSGFLDEHGVKVNTITSGPNKAIGNNMQPMTSEQRAILQSLVDEAYEQFAGIVAEGRKMDIDAVKKIADGRIYTAKQAKAVNLIDEICTYDEAVALMKNENKLKGVDVVNLNEESFGLLSSLLSKINLSKLRASILGDAPQSLINQTALEKQKLQIKYCCEELED